MQSLLWKKEIPGLFDAKRNVSIGKKTEDGEDFFFKALADRFWLILKSSLWCNKVDHGQPSIKWISWKGNDMLLKLD